MNEERKRQLAAKFVRIAKERLNALNRMVLSLGEQPSSELLEELARELHTLKGEARLLGFEATASLAHALEERIEPVRDDLSAFHGDVSGWLEGLDAIAQTLEATPNPARRREATLRVEAGELRRLSDTVTEFALHHSRWGTAVNELEVIAEIATPEIATRLRAVLARTREDLRGSEAMADELLDRVRALQMVELGGGLSRYPRAMHDLAGEQGKQVRVAIEVGGLLIDHAVLDRLHEPLLHVLRNAVDHGCEPPDERLANNKPPTATIHIGARLRGTDVELTVDDDGRGIDPQAVVRAALARKLITEENIAEVDAMSLLFEPGFSTRAGVTEVSGRGVGLDVVKQRVEAMGGSVWLRSEAGRGTTLGMRAPVSAMMQVALVVRVGPSHYALPLDDVDEIIGIDASRVERAADLPAIRWGETLLPLRDLGSVLGLRSPSITTQAVVVRAGERWVGWMVDRVLGERSLVLHGKGRFLSGTSILRDLGMTTDGISTLLLDTEALLDARSLPVNLAPPRVARAALTITVVDDSELSRDLLTRALRLRGHTVIEAVNGAEALRKVRETRPDVVFTDLDMPVMDGFALLGELRATPGLADLPIVVFSTRASPEDMARASERGATAYLVKTEFRDQQLDDLLTRVVGREDAR